MTVAVPLEAAKLAAISARGSSSTLVSVKREALLELVEFAEHFATRELPGTTVVAGELKAILLNLPDVEPQEFDLIRFNGRAFVPEQLEAVEGLFASQGRA
jgi:hypothetical protein